MFLHAFTVILPAVVYFFFPQRLVQNIPEWEKFADCK